MCGPPEFGDGRRCERAGKEITLAHIALEVGKLIKLFTGFDCLGYDHHAKFVYHGRHGPDDFAITRTAIDMLDKTPMIFRTSIWSF